MGLCFDAKGGEEGLKGVRASGFEGEDGGRLIDGWIRVEG